MSGDAVVVVPPGEGEVVQRRYGERTVVKAAEAGTRGAYAVRENWAPAGFNAVPFHLHREAEEAFYVLEGELTVFTEDRALAAPAGSFVLVPRGTVHSLANRGPVPVRWLTLISPAWVSGWIQAEAADPDDREAVYLRYGLEIVGPPPAPWRPAAAAGPRGGPGPRAAPPKGLSNGGAGSFKTLGSETR